MSYPSYSSSQYSFTFITLIHACHTPFIHLDQVDGIIPAHIGHSEKSTEEDDEWRQMTEPQVTSHAHILIFPPAVKYDTRILHPLNTLPPSPFAHCHYHCHYHCLCLCHCHCHLHPSQWSHLAVIAMAALATLILPIDTLITLAPYSLSLTPSHSPLLTPPLSVTEEPASCPCHGRPNYDPLPYTLTSSHTPHSRTHSLTLTLTLTSTPTPLSQRSQRAARAMADLPMTPSIPSHSFSLTLSHTHSLTHSHLVLTPSLSHSLLLPPLSHAITEESACCSCHGRSRPRGDGRSDHKRTHPHQHHHQRYRGISMGR